MMKANWLNATCLLALVVAAGPAVAQQTQVPETAQPSRGAKDTVPYGIEEIVVTAQRRSENLQRAAIAVSAVSGDTLAAAGVTRPAELTSLFPALQVAVAAGPYSLFYLRGVGNFNSNAFSDSAVAFNFDGVYIGRPSSSTGFFYDLERVEVVKGPQGTLYGRNATGGAVNVISNKPELGRFGGQGSAEFGNHDSVRLDGMVNLPIGDNAAFRLAGTRVRHDGYMNDGTDDQNDWGARASLRVEPSDAISINVVADYFEQRGKGAGSTPLRAPLGTPNAGTFDPASRIGFFSPEGQAFYTSQRAGPLGRNFRPFAPDFQSFQDNHWWGVSTTLDWRTDLGTLTLIPAYREGSLNFRSYGPGFQVRQTEDSEQSSFEARFATTEDRPLRALIGAFYFKDDTIDPAVSYASNWNAQYDSGPKLETESKAIFGRLTYAVTPGLRINVGARQTWEDKSFSGQRLSFTRICVIGNCPDAPSLPFGLTPPPERTTGFVAPGVLQAVLGPLVLNRKADFSKFTWRAGVDWDVTPQNLLFASFETGFKSGGFYFSPGAGSFAPETIESYTVGSKNRFFDNRLQLNLELFEWRYKDQQISHLVNILGVPTFATENVGRATFKGGELELKAAATETTTLTADFQYVDAKYDEFTFLQANSGGATSLAAFNGTACPTTSFDAANGNSFVVNCSGRRPAFAPKWTINLGLQQRAPVSFGEFVFDARAHYQTKTSVGLEFLPVESQDGYWLVDAQVTYNAPDERYFVSAFANNIFDKTVLGQMFPTPGTQFYSSTLRPPRTYGLRVGAKF